VAHLHQLRQERHVCKTVYLSWLFGCLPFRRPSGFKNGARTFQSAASREKRGVAEFFGAIERSRIAADWKVRAPVLFS